MPALQVRDFPETLYEELRACAERENRSISQQVIQIMQDCLPYYNDADNAGGFEHSFTHFAHPIGRKQNQLACALAQQELEEEERQKRIAKRKKIFEYLDAHPLPKIPDDFPSPAELIREDRDNRFCIGPEGLYKNDCY